MAFKRSFWVIAALAFALTSHARAQTLQRLTVTALTLSADTASPRIEVPFHLIITAHVRERITELDNVDLPILAELELLGDEHSLIASGNGTTYRETITVVAHHSGSITIAPVTLDAIDARDGRAKRYSSNPLTLNVAGGLAAMSVPQTSSPRTPWIPVIVAFAAAGLIWMLLARRRPAPAAPAAAVITLPPPVPVTPDPRRRAREWYEALRANPTRNGAMAIRSAVRRSVGANERETLADVLRRPLAQPAPMQRVLRALERAGFTTDADVPAAVRAALSALEEMTR